MNIEDIPCTSETIWQLTSLGQEEMSDAIRIDKFNYNPLAKHSNPAPEGAKAKELSTKDAETDQPKTTNPNGDNV